MKKLFIPLLLALVATSCNVARPVPTVDEGICRETVKLTKTTIFVKEHKSAIILNDGYNYAKVHWKAGPIKGSDNVYPNTVPDIVNLGCLDNISFTEE